MLSSLDVINLSRIAVGSVFILTAIGKVTNLRWFVGVVRGYRLLPTFAVAPSAIAFVAGESLVAILLLSNTAPRPAAFLACTLIALFSVAIVINLVRRRTTAPCGCTGPFLAAEHLSWQLIVRNGGLLGLALLASGAVSQSSTRLASTVAACSTMSVIYSLAGRRSVAAAEGNAPLRM